MFNPVSTYRIQFNKEFNFQEFEKIIPYLQKLGIGTVYASPVFDAVPGSLHGYDGVNPHTINPEIGTEEKLKNLSLQLKKQGISWLQDIVPNHMAFHPNNEWLMDVLEKGPQSKYKSFFDVTWNSPVYHGRIMVPFLGKTLEEVIDNNELHIAFYNQRLVFKYYDSFFPLQPKSYATILDTDDKPQAITQLLSQVPKMEAAELHHESWNEFRLQLGSLIKNDVVKKYIDSCLEKVNNDKNILLQISKEQSYRLCHWQETDKQINYRRFFTVNGLICLNIQNQEVFIHYHQLIKSLIDEGIFNGLRIDHIDGLFDPTKYLEQLRILAGEETYLIVEKILEPEEELPTQWPVQGNTGYDFLSIVNNLFTNKISRDDFNNFYIQLTGNNTSIQQQLRDKKAHILYNHMGGELENLYQLLLELNLLEQNVINAARAEDLKAAIGEFLIQCPVYRYYGSRLPLVENEAGYVQDIFNKIKDSKPELRQAVGILEEIFIKSPQMGREDFNTKAAYFYQRCMQFTGPLMAKGVEDTLMYTYNRFICHNEVGDSPEAFGYTIEEFHDKMIERQKQWPLSVNATSTHDTKRGEDVRARLNILTDLSEEWFQKIKEWQQLTKDNKHNGSPDPNDEYFIYQNLIGAYPMPGEKEDNFNSRMQEYLQKALREAKTHSNWTTPTEAYETATKNFAQSLLDKNKPFWNSFYDFHKKVARYGVINSLAQVLLKFTCPGVPDIYQGCELWDLSLVDPDNRRPVDYAKRQQWLDKLHNSDINDQAAIWKELINDPYNGKIKLWLIQYLLNERKHNSDLFAKGDYIPLQVEGKYKENVLAFARKHHHTWYIAAVPLHVAQLCEQQQKDFQTLSWSDTKIILPADIPKEWQNVFFKTTGNHTKEIPVQELFRIIPFGLIKFQSFNQRSAGILQHITSLPSPFGIGDMGPEAKVFADFLHRSQQKFWQLLPLNPTEEGQGHSPYSSISSKAGNTLLISPELLVKDGLLHADELKQYYLPQEGKVLYAEAERVKKAIFDHAWNTFKSHEETILHQQFKEFCLAEAAWLNDFALYMLLKDQHNSQPWFEWPDEYKFREPAALEKLTNDNAETLDKVKWLQFIFSRQWKKLKHYCNSREIHFLGDMPFYISYDSADVWANKEIFSLDEKGNRIGVAGVPPDAFSDEGQLWGMPLFRWDILKERGYNWWVQRFKKNMELFDVVRLDHFRAFSAYWNVSAVDQTAKNGQWMKGPGADLFNTVQKALGSLPFVAEDLGEIDDAVYQLRDEFNLPGMKILQFAFSEDLPLNPYIPHNYSQNFIAYTGTHDNNTVRGWYRHEVNDEMRRRIEQYIGRTLTEDDMPWAMCRLAYSSVAKTVVIPLQDILGLDEIARMNTPASGENNWQWRLLPGQLTQQAEVQLKEWTKMYNRR